MDVNICEDSVESRLKFESNLNFSISPDEDENDPKRKAARDPLSHRIIEKRRRDRMNNCLADLSRLIPASYLKKGRGRIEKTEIIEMAIKHLKHLQAHACNKSADNCEISRELESNSKSSGSEQFRQGYQECLSELMRFLFEEEGLYAGESLYSRLTAHLRKHLEEVSQTSSPEKLGHLSSGYATNCSSSTHSSESPQENGVSRILDVSRSPSVLDDLEQQESARFRNGLNLHLLNGMREDLLDERISPIPRQQRSYSFGTMSAPSRTFHPATFLARKRMEQISREQAKAMEAEHKPILNGGKPLFPQETSQLREILQNPQYVVDRLRASHHQANNNNNNNGIIRSCSFSAYGSVNKSDEVYKYKTNIKQRFNADLQQGGTMNHDQGDDDDSCHSAFNFHRPSKIRRYIDSRCSSPGVIHKSDHSPDSSPTSPIPPKAPKFTISQLLDTKPVINVNNRLEPAIPPGFEGGIGVIRSRQSSPHPTVAAANSESSSVPIFALHPKGSFYVPMTIDSSLVMPKISAVDSSSGGLHHVSISVYFNPVRSDA